MSGVNLLLGQGNSQEFLEADALIWQGLAGLDDDGRVFNLRSESQWIPASAGFIDQAFYNVFATFTWTCATRVRLRIKVDELEESISVGDFTFTYITPLLELEQQTDRTTKTFQFPLIYTMSVLGQEVARTGVRGRRMKVIVETEGGFAGEGVFVVDGIAVEHEALAETLVMQAAP